MPEFKGKKGRDPQVHVKAFENWAVCRDLPKSDWTACFPQTLKGTAQKWYYNYPPEKLPTYKIMAKALVQRFTDKKSDEELLSLLGRIQQKKMSVRQFVEEIKDLARQLSSPPGNKSLRAWFINGTSLKGVAKTETTNPTKTFEELVERAVKMERKGTKRQRTESSSSSSSSSDSSSDEEPVEKRRDWQKEIKMLKKKIEELSGVRQNMPTKGEKWCIHCREDDHTTSECVKCDYCEKRGHAWEECPVRLAPTVQIATPVVQEAAGPPSGQTGNPQPRYYRPRYAVNDNRPPRKLHC